MPIANSLIKTRILNPQTKLRLSKMVIAEFVKPIPEERVHELVLIAIQFDLPEVDEMLNCLNIDPIIDKYYGFKN
jgi:hypothetical protein